MITLYKLHYLLSFNRRLLYILIGLSILTSITGIIVMNSYEAINANELLYQYYLSSFQFIRLFSTIISIFISYNSFSSSNDSYKVMIIKGKKDRIKYILSKIILILFINILFTIIQIIIIISFGYIKTNIVKDYEFQSLFGLLVGEVFYSLLGILFGIVFNSTYYIIIPIFIYIFSLAVNDTIFSYIIICYNNIDLCLDYSYYIFISIALLLASIIIFMYKDFQ